ncbi:hypothetical protein ACOSP7_001345 [Xanthoceras sorbifolium]|uniref:Cotton fiber protein n=1 Tax=Xanthoceras sorbifolium TaxID=99658 RepID=A0ABQ8ILT2_9ROSI|nr:hypothetical protein JRO89_XS01G0283100 [Xanthoceras sorbifolium]
MSYLNLRLPPVRKAWKKFTSKLQSKLRKLNKSKAIKKPRKRPSSALLIDQRIQRKPSNKAISFCNHRRYGLKKKAAAVYIDRLFKEPIPEVIAKNVEWMDEREGGAAAGTSTEEKSTSVGEGDNMWEALGLTSPHMNEIDQRAEDFIRKFRADMRHQEMIARSL